MMQRQMKMNKYNNKKKFQLSPAKGCSVRSRNPFSIQCRFRTHTHTHRWERHPLSVHSSADLLDSNKKKCDEKHFILSGCRIFESGDEQKRGVGLEQLWESTEMRKPWGAGEEVDSSWEGTVAVSVNCLDLCETTRWYVMLRWIMVLKVEALEWTWDHTTKNVSPCWNTWAFYRLTCRWTLPFIPYCPKIKWCTVQ